MRDVRQFDLVAFLVGLLKSMKKIFHAYSPKESKLETRPVFCKEDSVYTLNFILCIIMLGLGLQNLSPSSCPSLPLCITEKSFQLSASVKYLPTLYSIYMLHKKAPKLRSLPIRK